MTSLVTGEFCFFVGDHAAPPVAGPFDPLTTQNLLRAIRFSWGKIHAELKGRPKVRARHYKENFLNGSLCLQLNTVLDNDELSYFTSAQFQTIVLEGKQHSARRAREPRMPDLQVLLVETGRLGIARSKAVLCIECKLLTDAEHLREYVINGMHRFVRGDYSPHMSLGIMLGYAAPEHQLPQALESYLKRARRSDAIRCKSKLKPFGSGDGACHVSKHVRRRPAFAKRINLLHLWLPHPAPRRRAKR
ncbi:hypothetical protein [Thiomonas sp. FB-Cd]|uniref:hypothetical protein n=1 Tax=Thiomonas sp. FB-Cd TaxID=1158292 RepID=UPI0004DF13EC|nr:hypothetical protein [Thiomonas sp. FB-Cd]